MIRPKESRVWSRVWSDGCGQWCAVVTVDQEEVAGVTFPTYTKANAWRLAKQREMRDLLGEKAQDGRNRSAD